jgi:hypothetical protein
VFEPRTAHFLDSPATRMISLGVAGSAGSSEAASKSGFSQVPASEGGA